MKRKIAMLIVMAFMLSNIALAEGDGIFTIEPIPKPDISMSFRIMCGDNLWFEMDSQSSVEVLHIYGTGDMYNYNEGTVPWPTTAKKIFLDDGVTYIGNYAFCNFKNLSEIKIPDTITEIGYDTFKNCTALVSVDIPDNVKIIGSSAFEGCSNLRYVTLPSNIKNIHHFTFAMCKKLEEIEIYDGVKEIGQGAFTNCSNLATIHIPDTVMEIGSKTFYGCNALETVYYGGSKTQWENISIASGNSALDSAKIVCLTEDEIMNNEVCYICNNEIADDRLFYDGKGNVICRSCNEELQQVQENEKTLCFYCGNEITNNNSFYDNDNLICQSCYDELQEVEKAVCPYCEREFEVTDDVFDNNGDIICPYCDENITEETEEEIAEIECPYCGEIFDDNEDIYDSDGYAVCPYCDEYIDNMEEITDETSDVDFATSDWATEEIYEAYNQNLIPNELFSEPLYKTISREEFAAVAVKLYEKVESEIPEVSIYDTPFEDCNYESEYNNYIAAAYATGITTGTGDTTFSPYQSITREQLATMLARISTIIYYEPISYFDDHNSISEYAIESVYQMARAGVIKGVGNNCFAPKETATREQAIIMALRLYKSIDDFWY